MKRLLFVSALALLPPVAGAQSAADPEPTVESLGLSSWRFDWVGTTGWTWFIQWSEDLVTWHYFPVIEHGTDFDYFELSTDADRFFLRLRFIHNDENSPGFVDPETGDFDGDGLSNLFEVMHGLDPFSTDSDGDLVLDGAEDEDLDGSVNTTEAVAGRNPAVKDHPAVKLSVVVGS